MNAAIHSDSPVDLNHFVEWLHRRTKPEFRLVVRLDPNQIVERIDERVAARRSAQGSDLSPYGRFDARNLRLYRYLPGVVPFLHDPPPLRIAFEQDAAYTTVIGTLDLTDATILPPVSTTVAFAGVFALITAVYADPGMMLQFAGISLGMGSAYSAVQQVRRINHLTAYGDFLTSVLATPDDDEAKSDQ